LWIAATFGAQADTGAIRRVEPIMTIISFAESSAELTFDAIRTLSNIARDMRLAGVKEDVIYLDAEIAPAPVTRLRLAQIRNLLIDLGVPSGQLVISAEPADHPPFAAIRAVRKLPPIGAGEGEKPPSGPNSAE